MDFCGELVGERASEIVSGTSKGLLSWLSWDLLEMFGMISLLLDIIGLEEISIICLKGKSIIFSWAFFSEKKAIVKTCFSSLASKVSVSF